MYLVSLCHDKMKLGCVFEGTQGSNTYQFGPYIRVKIKRLMPPFDPGDLLWSGPNAFFVFQLRDVFQIHGDVLPNVVHMFFFVQSLVVDFQMCISHCAMYFQLANDSMQELPVPGRANSVLEEVKPSIELEESPASQSGWFCCAAWVVAVERLEHWQHEVDGMLECGTRWPKKTSKDAFAGSKMREKVSQNRRCRFWCSLFLSMKSPRW